MKEKALLALTLPHNYYKYIYNLIIYMLLLLSMSIVIIIDVLPLFVPSKK